MKSSLHYLSRNLASHNHSSPLAQPLTIIQASTQPPQWQFSAVTPPDTWCDAEAWQTLPWGTSCAIKSRQLSSLGTWLYDYLLLDGYTLLVTLESTGFGLKNSRKVTLVSALWCKTDVCWGWSCHRQAKTQFQYGNHSMHCSGILFFWHQHQWVHKRQILLWSNHRNSCPLYYRHLITPTKRSRNLLLDPDLETNPMQPASSVAAISNTPAMYATLQENPAATATKLVTLQMFVNKLPKTEEL